MAKLVWDQTGERTYETGVKNGVLYPVSSGVYGTGVAWNGLTSITESPSGAETTSLYADDIKYLNLVSAEEFGGTIEAYTYPDEFKECDGSKDIATGVVIGQQDRKMFGLCYKTTVGNDTDGNAYGYNSITFICYFCCSGSKSLHYLEDLIDFNTKPLVATHWIVSLPCNMI